ncbi:heme lyase CcmF/NrfE family subunit [Pseudosporangium ferrugineum]|uniref:Cytochrome c-type biogenesis protein CcmF n=1 Tax=Pseudosporangium ferrugineum TaxID=439699 RepID=A0A2T0RGC2_9ACTN|nr:cytochrome c-type biogenesis CcmF C-terminal domain-containing protein [Pseudosporangium ferrugineum]PRY20182.1 cytochrome c-type biogenesis protein CcmF [Pseudosporangium ferrugineum]
MTGQIGGIVLGAGLVAAVATALLWSRVALLGVSARPARAATWATLAMAVLACAVLEVALVGHDFSIRYVAENGGRDVPLYYTVTSLWAALDGSLLLWLLVLAGCAVVVGGRRPERSGPLQPYAMAVIGVVAVFFFALTYFAANPFTAVSPVPADGPGPNPLLREHPAMGVHPPLLYAGYIGLVVPFAYGVAALLAGRTDRLSVTVVRRWTLVSWVLLTGGITLGAWWSYAVLGWGGYWAWDPVENASLLPWLTATALLHTLLAGRRTPALRSWTIALACSSFLLVLVGTFLTRSGAVASVHAFTASPLGPMLLGFVLLSVAVVLGLLVSRSGTAAAANPSPLLARESVMLGNAVLMVAVAAIVLTGTLFPLLVQAVQGHRAAVGPGYFNRAAVPVALVVLLLMGLAPLLRPGRAADLRDLRVPAFAGLAVAAVIGMLSRPGVLALAAFALGAYVLTGLAQSLVRRRGDLRRWGWMTAHAGIAVVAVGVAASSAYTVSSERQLRAGESITVGGVTARLETVDRLGAANGMRVRVRLALGGDAGGTSEPQLRYYPARDLTVSVPAIRSGVTGDVYATVLGAAPDGTGATVRLAVNPLVWLVWLGGGMTALGALTAAVRAPSRRRSPSPSPETPVPVGAA